MTAGTELFSLRGRTVLVTGATGYLGSQMAFALAESGATVLVNSRSETRCAALVAQLRDAGHAAESAAFDVTAPEAINGYFSAFGDRPLHVLINNAYGGGAGTIETATDAAYLESYDVTVRAAHNVTMSALPRLREAVRQTGDASVINIASMYASVSPDQRIYTPREHSNPPFYGAAKAALVQWTRYAACEFGRESIRFNCLSPGPFPSDATRRDGGEFVSRLEQKVPMGRVGMAREIKGPTVFLASSASSFVNGANIPVDGGWTCW